MNEEVDNVFSDEFEEYLDAIEENRRNAELRDIEELSMMVNRLHRGTKE